MNSYVISTKDFISSLKIQLRVIHAILMREIITRFGRHNIGFMWLFIEPMMFTTGVATFWYLSKGVHGNNIAIVPFAVIGYSSVLGWRNGAGRVQNAIEANTGLLYHRNVKVLDLFLARLMLEFSGASMSFFILSIFFILIGLMEVPKDLLLMCTGWLFLGWFSIAFGLILGGLAELSEIIEKIWHPLTYLLFPLAGAAFFVEWLPPAFQKVVLWLPMVHSTEMMRHGYYGDLIPTHESFIFLIVANTCLSFIGLTVVRYVSAKVEAR